MRLRNILVIVFILLLGIPVLFMGCKGKKADVKTVPVEQKNVPIVIGNETSLLLSDLVESGDYVNGKDFPSLIKASIVQESLDKNIMIVDLRSAKQFADGHIKGAVNKKFEELPSWLQTGIKPFEYEKIVMVCDDGQISSYTTCLLQLMGYGNVYAMRWGMSSWNEKYANEGWLSGVSGKFEQDLETKTNEHPVPNNMPDLNTGFASGAEISAARFAKLFEEGTSHVLIGSEVVFNNPLQYYVVNLERKDKYEDGHVPGALRYKPEETLGFTEVMATIPAHKTVVVYCGTGHNSAFATAYLRMFGYDARTLKYGNNGFMYNKMVTQKKELSWLPFTNADVNSFDVVK
jgi:rhodanese-related sulfurtransferase